MRKWLLAGAAALAVAFTALSPKSRAKAAMTKTARMIPFQNGKAPYFFRSAELKKSTMPAKRPMSAGSHTQKGEWGSRTPRAGSTPGVRKAMTALAL
mgnify:CR=1 FL=1